MARALRDPVAVKERLTRIDEPHVAPLNAWVRELQRRLGSGAIVPWFDPDDGGVAAEVLWLLEAPGGKATRERGGSGFISCDNDDATAQNAYETRNEAGLDRKLVVHWNVIPYYIGSTTKIRAWDPSDVAAAGPLLSELLGLLPRLRCVMLGGGAAQRAWRDFGPADTRLEVIECPHPSATNVNTRPGTRAAIVQAWATARRS